MDRKETDMNAFEKIGEDKLREVIEDFYERVIKDVMIGFLFAGKNKFRLIQKEYEFTAKFLGADIAYTGKPMRQAHAASPIMGGHFERRMIILKQTLADNEVHEDVQKIWLGHTEALRPQVTGDPHGECIDKE